MTQEETERLRSQLHRRDPAPFVELLIQVLQSAPSSEDIAKFARAQPDRFIKMTSQLARVVGYSEKIEVDHNHRHRLRIEAMSDSQLLAFVKEQRKALPLDDVIEAEAVEVKGGPANVGPDPGDLRRMGLGEPAAESSAKTVPLAAVDASEEEQPK